LGDQIKKNEMGTACGKYGGQRGAYRVLLGRPEGKRLLGRLRRKWKNKIKMDLLQVGLGGADWIGLAQYRDRWRELVNAVTNLWIP